MGINPPPGLSKTRNLSDLRSRAAALANLLPVTQRGPTGNDNSPNYTVGQSLWLEPDGQLSQLQSILPSGKAMWTPIANPGRAPGEVVSGAVFQGGTKLANWNYFGKLFQVTRASDLTTLDVGQLGTNPDLSALGNFLAPNLGIGYISKLYDQSGAGNDAVQTSMGSMPRIDLATVIGDNLPIQFDSGRRNYWLGGMGPLGNGTWPATLVSGANITLNQMGATAAGCSISGTTATLATPGVGSNNGFWRQGQILSGAGVTAGTVLGQAITLVDPFGSGTWTVSPSQTVSNVTITGTATAVLPDVVPGVIVTGTNIPVCVIVGTIAGTTLTVSSVTSGAVAAGMFLYGGLGDTKIISGSGSTWTIDKNQTVSTPTTFYGNTTISSINATTGAVALSCAPTGALTTLSFLSPPVFLDLPNAMQVPWQSWGAIYSAEAPNGIKPFMFGVHGNDALNNATGTFSGMMDPGVALPWGFRIFNGNNIGSSPILGGTAQTTPLVWGFSNGGTNGRTLNYLYDGVIASQPLAMSSLPATTLSGGCIGYNRQLNGANVGGQTSDWLLYDVLLYPQTLSTSDMQNISASINLLRDWTPQVIDSYAADGSSTTFGAGTNQMLAWAEQAGRRLRTVAPRQAYVEPQGGTIETMIGNFGLFCGHVPIGKRTLLLVHFGLGNSLQAGGTFTITGQSGSVLTTAVGTTNSDLAGIGVSISGPNLAPNSRIIGFTTNAITVSPAPTAPFAGNWTLTVVNDTAALAWTNMQAYAAQALSFGYEKIVFIGSCSRKSFSTSITANTLNNLAEFNTVKTFMRELWPTVPGVVGFIDWEDDPYFGSDGATMVVQSIVNGTITVQAASQYVAVGNRVRWAGMPTDVVANTGGQNFATVAGNSFTVTGATTGLAPGSIIQAISPAPWSAFPGELGLGLNPDGQHFCKQAYWRQGDMVAQYLLDNNII